MALASALAERVPDRAFAYSIALAHRRFEPILRQVRMFVAPNQTAIDVGAWYGPWTHWLAKAARSVVTVEANPDLAAFVARTSPPNVTVVPKAASDTEGVAELWLPAGGKGTEGRASLINQGPGRTLKVETIRLDSLDVDNVGLVKIDVEGHEAAALRGAEELVRRWRPVLIVEVEDTRAPAAETLGLLDGWGYRGSFFRDGGWHPLAGFDLARHQRESADAGERGYLRIVLEGSGDRYVNTIVFRPSPGASPA